MDQPRQGAPRRSWRASVTAPLIDAQDGIASRSQLRSLGVTRWDVRDEVAAGRWRLVGRQAIVLVPGGDEARRWRAVFEVGAGARLDGVSALMHAGLSGWRHDTIDVSVPHGTRVRRRVEGVTIHAPRHLEPAVLAGIPRARPIEAVLRAASWARSDRQAATLLAMAVQQRLARPERLLAALTMTRGARRGAFVRRVVHDVCAGAESLGELDFAVLCRRYGLPTPERQVVRHVAGGRYYLDVRWRDCALVVEIDGAHHGLGLSPVDDALRQNAVTLDGDLVLRIPVLGLRLYEREFMTQVVAAHGRSHRRTA